MIDEDILARLKVITPEEQAILDGQAVIDRGIYMTSQSNEINAMKLLSEGKLITLRPHTRFIDFPDHWHDYIEMIYVCSGKSTHIVDGKTICLSQGDLLFLNQHAHHSVLKAGIDDLSINFIILPEFFHSTISAISDESPLIQQFLLSCLFGQDNGSRYLYFQISKNNSIQNLVENLIITLLAEEKQNRRKISQMTMTLLFLELSGYTEKLDLSNREIQILHTLRYLEAHYTDGSLTEVANQLNVSPSTISREIHRQTGKTYTELLQQKRLSQAAFLLRNTNRKISDIAMTVGYENISYFYRLFDDAYGVSPRAYRTSQK